MNDERTIVGLDIGTEVIKVAVGKYDDNGKLEIVATSSKKSVGLKNGVIVNIEDAKDAIKAAIEEVEQNAGMLVNSVIVAVGGSLIQSENATATVPIKPNPKTNRKEVTQDDIDQVIDMAIAINSPADREKIHVIPQRYLVDGISIGTQSPINRLGNKLAVEFVDIAELEFNIAESNISEISLPTIFSLLRLLISPRHKFRQIV